MAEIPPTPELEKMGRVREESQAIGEFLEWLSSTKHVHLAQSVEGYNFPQHFAYQTEELLAEFFEIDLKKVEAERRAILASLRGES
jgi:hypothetical protein